MLDKIKENISKITFVLSIVAGALLVPSFLVRLEAELTESAIISLIYYTMLLAACISLLLSSKGRAAITVSHVLFYSALAFSSVYNALSGSLSSFATAALYLAVTILIFIPGVKNAFKTVSLIAIAFFIAAALGGGAVNLSILLTSLLIAANCYFNEEKE